MGDESMAKAIVEIDTDGDVNLRGSRIRKLPDNLTVGGDLDLRGTGITELPDNLKVAGTIYGFNPPVPIAPSGERPNAPHHQPRP
jgi:hypothetical protein